MNNRKFKMAGLVVVFLWFFVGGIGHFTNTAMFVRIVPPYIPYALAAVYISGMFELLGAIGIWIPRYRQWAGNGLIALTICVTPANLYMRMNPQLFPEFSVTLLTVRLFVQIALLVCIGWATRTPTNSLRVDPT